MFYLLILFVLLLDQGTKALALAFLDLHTTIPVISGILHWTLVYNTGIAFGFFQSHPRLLLGLITLSLVVLFFWGRSLGKTSQKVSVCFALILGGAVGNWIDRIRFQAVIDFIDLRVWPVFNVADSAITIGVCFYLILILRKKA